MHVLWLSAYCSDNMFDRAHRYKILFNWYLSNYKIFLIIKITYVPIKNTMKIIYILNTFNKFNN